MKIILGLLATFVGGTYAFAAEALTPQIRTSLVEAASIGGPGHVITAVVIAIADHPNQSAEIVREAVRLVPQWSNEILVGALRAFPEFADEIVSGSAVGASVFSTNDAEAPLATDMWWHEGWSGTVFLGALSVSDTSDIFSGSVDIEDSGVIGTAVSKKLFNTSENLVWETEVQASKHFGDQDHWEFNALILARWRAFPWNDVVLTTAAIGDGLSIATEVPKLEETTRSDDSTDFLNLLFAEITLAPPAKPDVSLSLRYHHRSGIFGIFDGVTEGSTVFALGLKYRF